MAPFDLPPEPPLTQPVKFSRSAADLQLINPGTQPPSSNSVAMPSSATAILLGELDTPVSLIPTGQLATIRSEDFSIPNLAQLPPLPDKPPSAPVNTLDIINNAVDEQLDDGELDLDTITPDSVDLDSLDPNAVDLDDLNDTVDLEELESEELDLNQAPSVIEDALDTATPEEAETAPISPPASQPAGDTAVPPEPLDPSQLEITSDIQIFNSDRQVVNARGNVVFKLNNAFLLADEIWVNLVNRYVLAEGNVILTRGEQEVRGERAEYNLLQEAGTLFETRGELFLPGLEDDFSSPLERPITSRSVFDPLNPDQTVTNVTNAGGFEISSRLRGNTPGSLPESSGGVRRLRFEAARVTFDAEAWIAEEVRLTNDPFSPPELEFRTNRMTLVTLSPTADLLTTENPRLVLDQGLAIPLFKERYVLNRGNVESNQLNPFIVNVGSDSRERGGIFLESEFSLVRNESTSFSITPQYFLQRSLEKGAFNSDVLGLELDFDTRLNPRSDVSAQATITGLNLDEIEDNIRGNIRNRLLVGDHLLVSEYSYRDRLFNGSLGFQTVRSSLGAVLLSPVINLDNRGLILTYQVGGQWITAETDRTELLDPLPRDNNRVSLGRFQGTARLSKGFNLWRGKPLPATQTEGLRYSPIPLVPFLNLSVSLLGVGSYYTSGDFQEVLAGDVRLDGQFGHLSDNFFDYTRFNLGYYHAFLASENSPFLFDRNVDRSVVTFGVVQQILGPFLLGFQASINLETNQRVNTEIIGEYSRRTHGLVVRYSPTQSTGSIGFRLSDFNWLGSGSPFDNPNIRQVEGSVLDQR